MMFLAACGVSPLGGGGNEAVGGSGGSTADCTGGETVAGVGGAGAGFQSGVGGAGAGFQSGVGGAGAGFQSGVGGQRANTCDTPNPAGCKSQGCPADQLCVDEGCTPSDCACDASGQWICTDDCGGGICVPDGAGCSDPNPVGCKVQGCPQGEVCVDQGCAPSVCSCDASVDAWICTDDCGGGICAPAP
jgi:hypothetical protein